jgi:16S rRNA (uracil1498-N3)-methyltransferase
MRLTRVYVDDTLLTGTVVELPRDTAAHLAKVLRIRGGDEIVLFSGDGREYVAAIETVRGSRVTAMVGRGTDVDRESPLSVTLLQCIPRGDRMDMIVQKATELGVQRIVPVISQRSVVRLDATQAGAKGAHWRAVAVSACEQCGRTRLPVVEDPVPLLTYLGTAAKPAVRLVLEPDSSQGTVDLGPDLPVEVGVGPEGGFDSEELDALELAGFARLGLGPRILRTETAAIAAVTWLQTRIGDMRVGAAPARTVR